MDWQTFAHSRPDAREARRMGTGFGAELQAPAPATSSEASARALMA
jgi:hypothetical protein